MTGQDAMPVIEEFVAHRLFRPESRVRPDVALFEELVRGVLDDTAAVDVIISEVLTAGWTTERLESTLRAILRLGIHELVHHAATPYEVVIAEYVDIAHAFHDPPAAGLVNGLLERVSARVRPEIRDSCA